jgi:drug/metabolite transporter (DMT)-like permease
VPILEVAWFRYLANFVGALVFYNPVAAPEAWRMKHPLLQLTRASLLAIVTFANFMAMHYLQLTETTTIGFLSPLVITLLSVIVLHESIDPPRLLAIGVGFLGVLLVTRPGFGGFHPAMLLSLVAVVAGAVYNMVTRFLAQRETAGSMVLMLAGVPSILIAPVMPFVWQTPERPILWAGLIFIGAAGGYGHYLVMIAHRYATAAALAPYSYASLLWMVTTGYLVFGDVPSLWTLAGAALVIGAGLYLLRRERRSRR